FREVETQVVWPCRSGDLTRELCVSTSAAGCRNRALADGRPRVSLQATIDAYVDLAASVLGRHAEHEFRRTVAEVDLRIADPIAVADLVHVDGFTGFAFDFDAAFTRERLGLDLVKPVEA